MGKWRFKIFYSNSLYIFKLHIQWKPSIWKYQILVNVLFLSFCIVRCEITSMKMWDTQIWRKEKKSSTNKDVKFHSFPPVCHPSCPTSLLFFFSSVLDPTCPSSLMSVITPIWHPSCPAYLLSCISPICSVVDPHGSGAFAWILIHN